MVRTAVWSATLALIAGSAGCTVHTHSGPPPEPATVEGTGEGGEASANDDASSGGSGAATPEVAARRTEGAAEQKGDGSQGDPIVIARRPALELPARPNINPQLGGGAGSGGSDDGDDDAGDTDDTEGADDTGDDAGDTGDDADDTGDDAGDSDDADDTGDTTPAKLTVSCSFDDGWVSVLPANAFNPDMEFLMQALIGLTTDPGFWKEQDSFAAYEPYKAARCKPDGTHFQMPEGRYRVLVGWAGRYEVHGDYKNNGHIAEIELGADEDESIALEQGDMTETWVCISCPYLAVYRGGELVDVGQVLVDRYTIRRKGTDVVRTKADVRDGRLRLVIAEREPEVTHLDAVAVSLGGRALEPASDQPDAVAVADGEVRELSLGDSLELVYEAPGVEDGSVDVEVRVTGHYEPVGPML